MNTDSSTLYLFGDTPDEAARIDAIDKLHASTAIYTAEPTVDALLSRLNWPNGHAKMIDPSAGDGMFLSRALTKALSLRAYDDERLAGLLEGWEIHPHACIDARSRIAAVMISHGRSAAAATCFAERIVKNRDFLTEAPTVPTWHVVAGNPPYLRKINVPSLLRDIYASHVPSYAAGDMLHSFLDRCTRTLIEGGEMGFVTADRWLFAQGAAELREAIGRRLTLQHLERLEGSVFYRPKMRRAGSPPRIHPVSVVFGMGKGRALTRDAIYPGVDADRYAGMPTLQEIAEVRIAPWLGTGGIFVVSQAEAQAAGLPAEALVPAIDTDDIVGNGIGTPSRYAIRTRPDTMPCAAVMAHLERRMHGMAQRGRQGKMWMPPESFHRMDISLPSLLVPRIAKTPKAVDVPPGILPINHNLSIVTGDAAQLERVRKALASDLAAQWVREHAAPLENGYFSLTTTLLRKMPVELD